jgi:peptide/nickel transport system substrate-binding protein
MRELLYARHGLLGNDLLSPYDPLYDPSIPQIVQDLEQAKSLLRQAGHETLSVELVIAEVGPRAIQMCEILKQNAAGAGITINLRQSTVTELYSN